MSRDSYQLYINGAFFRSFFLSFIQEIDSPSSASCSNLATTEQLANSVTYNTLEQATVTNFNNASQTTTSSFIFVRSD